MRSVKHVAAAVSLAAVGACAASAAGASITDYNLVVLGNLTNGSHDVEGRLFVGGNFTAQAPTLAKNLSAGALAGVSTVDVAGSISVNTINLQAGNIRYGTTFSGGVNFNGGGSGVQSATQASAALSALKTQFISEAAGLSSVLKNLPANSSVSVPSGQPGAVVFTASPVGGLAVFNVSAAQVFSGLTQQIDLVLNGAQNVVINVTGASANWTTGNMTGAWQSLQVRSHLIWNFHEATTLSFNNQWNGALLAPGATLQNFTEMNGSVFVGAMNQSGEVHLPLYQGYVPGPGAAGLIALGGLVAARRRRCPNG